MLRRLAEDWLLIADRNFYNWEELVRAADRGGAAGRVKSDLRLPVLGLFHDGSCRSVLVSPKVRGKAREQLVEAACRGEDLDQGKARHVRVIEYEVPDREGGGTGELIALITTITDPRQAQAGHPGGGLSRKMGARDRKPAAQDVPAQPGGCSLAVPDMVRQEMYGYLLTHYAISALICRAATEADIDPDRVNVKRTVRILRLGRRPVFFPLNSGNELPPGSWPRSLRRRALTRRAVTGPTHGWSSRPGTTPTG